MNPTNLQGVSTAGDVVAETRIVGLDRERRLTGHYARLDGDAIRRAKAKLHCAFLSYESAVRDGDTDVAMAARARFLEAASALKGGRP